MAEVATKRLNQAAKDLNVGLSTIVDFLAGKGHQIENKPTTKLTAEQVSLLDKAFESSAQDKIEADRLSQAKRQSDLDAAPKPSAPAPRPMQAAPGPAPRRVFDRSPPARAIRPR